MRRYDFTDEKEHSLAAVLHVAADFVESYDGGIMDMTLAFDDDGPIVSLFTDDLPDTEGALIEQAVKVVRVMDKAKERLLSQPDMHDEVRGARHDLARAVAVSREGRK